MTAPPGDPSVAAELAAARDAADAGDEAGAEAIFLELFDRYRDSGTSTEAQACSSLVTLYGRQQRFFESLTLAARLRALGEADPRDPGTLAYSAFARATGWLYLHSLDRAAAEIERLAESLPVEGVRGLLLARGHHALRVRLLLAREDADAAEEELDRYESTFPSARVVPSDHLVLHLRRASVLVLRGRFEDALREIERAEPHAADVPDRARTELQRLEVLARAGRDEQLVDRSVGLLAHLEEALEALPHSSQLAWDGGRRIIELLPVAADADDLLPRSWALISSALARRLQELGRALLRLPELASPDSDDVRAFGERKASDTRWRRDERRRLRPLFDRLRRDLPPPTAELLRSCAWCDSIDLGGDRWVPFLEGVEEASPGSLTHGICPSCQRLESARH